MLKAFLKADVIISVILFAVSLYLLSEIKIYDSGSVYGKLGPAYWPKFVLYMIMFLSVGVAFFSIKGVLQGTIPPFERLQFSSANLRFGAAVALIAGYLLLLPYVGFLVLTPLQMIAFMFLLGERNKVLIFSIPFVLTLGIVLLFTKVMYVPLPRGAGVFLEISHLLY
ncbi:tripartite tricarboxylate transporter TctB family protein [Desulfofustis glycolicus]|uniref:Tripartite tricarboxylate transporter TctB family protein n=1 Tax=Desulfofustis glycolicus DSM 9705 TaxID=1121409 RepID=A0A1M5T748_9BACT|nr:tripartite tricarboxylate transporter TctB family protein [Desulfofustis glycolicus]MCB2215396.1 tripartite tricarboxylate transporter TctB family protein [Desulfobulbaceae bacterium]SHH46536.1 Tripartite tricarboxylate transporter TctB family protein [Desulfofustis glycolicus DSM 9705]